IDESRALFALVLFVGLIVHGMFAEIINRAPTLILSNANYVKKVVFPIEILSVITIVVALFHTAISLFVLLIAFFLINGFLHWTFIFVPLILLPLIIFSMGVSWVLSSLGVFVRDVGQIIGILTTVLLFLAPVMYPITAVP